MNNTRPIPANHDGAGQVHNRMALFLHVTHAIKHLPQRLVPLPVSRPSQTVLQANPCQTHLPRRNLDERNHERAFFVVGPKFALVPGHEDDGGHGTGSDVALEVEECGRVVAPVVDCLGWFFEGDLFLGRVGGGGWLRWIWSLGWWV